MNLLLYACCQAFDRQHPAEQSVLVEWTEQPPAIGDVVSMGRQKHWAIVEVAAYKPITLGQAVRAVYLAFVQREDLPLTPKADWSFHPQKTIHVHLTAIDEPELQLGFNVLGDPPQIGECLLSHEATTPKVAWVIDRYDTYLPEAHASYSAIYLAWCLVHERSIVG